MTEYTNFVKDFAERSRSNLMRLEAKERRGGKYYEVTQLINSLLGMLVFIQEDESLPNVRVECIQDFPSITTTVGAQKGKLRSLIKALRDAVAHGQIKDFSEDDKTIAGFTFWTTSTRGKKPRAPVWKVALTLENIRWIANYLTNRISDES
ncbi:MAG: HEPN family nuclease [Proteobacteria bacterium]|nr:HEPN family nuclease [Pseudomonadota bacterium]